MTKINHDPKNNLYLVKPDAISVKDDKTVVSI